MMTTLHSLTRRALRASGCALAVLCLLATPVQAQPRTPPTTLNAVAPLDAPTWQRLLDKGPRPAAYLFATTGCTPCQSAFRQLRDYVLTQRRMAELVVVWMDVERFKALEHASEFQSATRVYAFHGDAAAIRRSIEPHWPDAEPFIVLVDRSGFVMRHSGAPSAQLLQQWLQ